MKTYNIRVRADYVGYYKVKAKSLGDAEAMAQQQLFDEMNDEVDGVFDFEEFEDEEHDAHKEISAMGRGSPRQSSLYDKRG
jgi:hypothetical protein